MPRVYRKGVRGRSTVSSWQIYHNPRCSKSRQTLALLQENGVEPEIREYLKKAPTVAELKTLITMLNAEASDVVRSGEAVYKELGFKDKPPSSADLIEAIAANPILLERPIVVHGNQAVIGRPPENVLALIND